MKTFIISLFLVITTAVYSQKTTYNIQDGAVAAGYDVVAYFHHKAINGNKKFTTTYQGVTFRFSSKENLETFKKSPKKYIPQYGGYCAYAMGKNGEKVNINPKTFEIRDGKLYLFYNAWLTNTLELWLKEGPKELQKRADKFWNKSIN